MVRIQSMAASIIVNVNILTFRGRYRLCTGYLTEISGDITIYLSNCGTCTSFSFNDLMLEIPH